MHEHPWVIWTGNLAAAATVIGTLAGWLPVAAAIVAIIWYSIEIWESKTALGWRRRRILRKMIRIKSSLLKGQLALAHDETITKKEQEYWLKMATQSQLVLNDLNDHIKETLPS